MCKNRPMHQMEPYIKLDPCIKFDPYIKWIHASNRPMQQMNASHQLDLCIRPKHQLDNSAGGGDQTSIFMCKEVIIHVRPHINHALINRHIN